MADGGAFYIDQFSCIRTRIPQVADCGIAEDIACFSDFFVPAPLLELAGRQAIVLFHPLHQFRKLHTIEEFFP